MHMCGVSFVGKLVLFVFSTQLVSGHVSCPNGQIWHQSTHSCCVPMQGCNIESEIQPCTQNGTLDRCVPCGQGRTNGYITSSFDFPSHMCFDLKERHKDCPRGDTVPIPTHQSEKCAQPCRCRSEACYHGDPCACDLIEMCGVDQELHSSGECRPCPEGKYKPLRGCGQCLWNITAWKLKNSNHYEVANATVENDTVIEVIEDIKRSKTSSTVPPSGDPQKKAEEEGISMAAVMIVIAVLVAFGLMIALVLLARQKIKSGDRSSPLVRCYYNILRKPQPSDPEMAQPQQPDSPPVQEVAPLVETSGANGGPEEPRMEPLKSSEPNGHAATDHPPAGEPVANGGVEPTEPEDEGNTTITPLIGGTIREDDETEQKIKG